VLPRSEQLTNNGDTHYSFSSLSMLLSADLLFDKVYV
jgi:hypothetical protein